MKKLFLLLILGGIVNANASPADRFTCQTKVSDADGNLVLATKLQPVGVRMPSPTSISLPGAKVFVTEGDLTIDHARADKSSAGILWRYYHAVEKDDQGNPIRARQYVCGTMRTCGAAAPGEHQICSQSICALPGDPFDPNNHQWVDTSILSESDVPRFVLGSLPPVSLTTAGHKYQFDCQHVGTTL